MPEVTRSAHVALSASKEGTSLRNSEKASSAVPTGSTEVQSPPALEMVPCCSLEHHWMPGPVSLLEHMMVVQGGMNGKKKTKRTRTVEQGSVLH
jgi:hypothetical protein